MTLRQAGPIGSLGEIRKLFPDDDQYLRGLIAMNTGVVDGVISFLNGVYSRSLQEDNDTVMYLERFVEWILSQGAVFYEVYERKDFADFTISERQAWLESKLLPQPEAIKIADITDGNTCIADFFTKALEVEEMVNFIASIPVYRSTETARRPVRARMRSKKKSKGGPQKAIEQSDRAADKGYYLYSQLFTIIPLSLMTLDFRRIFPDPAYIPDSLSNLVTNVIALQAWFFNEGDARDGVALRPDHVAALDKVLLYRLAEMHIRRKLVASNLRGEFPDLEIFRNDVFGIGQRFPQLQRGLWQTSVNEILSLITRISPSVLDRQLITREELHTVDSDAARTFLEALHTDLMVRIGEIRDQWKRYHTVHFDLSESLYALRLGITSIDFTLEDYPDLDIRLIIDNGQWMNLGVNVETTTPPNTSVPRFSSQFGISEQLSRDLHILIYSCLVDLLNKTLLDQVTESKSKIQLVYNPVAWAFQQGATELSQFDTAIYAASVGETDFIDILTGGVSKIPADVGIAAVRVGNNFHYRPAVSLHRRNLSLEYLLLMYSQIPRLAQLELLLLPYRSLR